MKIQSRTLSSTGQAFVFRLDSKSKHVLSTAIVYHSFESPSWICTTVTPKPPEASQVQADLASEERVMDTFAAGTKAEWRRLKTRRKNLRR